METIAAPVLQEAPAAVKLAAAGVPGLHMPLIAAGETGDEGFASGVKEEASAPLLPLMATWSSSAAARTIEQGLLVRLKYPGGEETPASLPVSPYLSRDSQVQAEASKFRHEGSSRAAQDSERPALARDTTAAAAARQSATAADTTATATGESPGHQRETHLWGQLQRTRQQQQRLMQQQQNLQQQPISQKNHLIPHQQLARQPQQQKQQ
ncbi:hypothetical protein Esti_003852 [Eimeria stiedai]